MSNDMVPDDEVPVSLGNVKSYSCIFHQDGVYRLVVLNFYAISLVLMIPSITYWVVSLQKASISHSKVRD